MTVAMRALAALLLAGGILSAFTTPARARATPTQGQKLNYTTSWVGNTFGGKDGKWVSMDMDALFVTPDGTCYTNTPWDENGREIGIFKNGQVLGKGPYKQFTHGWGWSGGGAIAANDKHVFVAQNVGSESGGLRNPTTWPAKSKTWFGVSRRLRSDVSQGAPFAGGKGGGEAEGRGPGSAKQTLAQSFLLVNEVAEKEKAAPVAGLAATNRRLYVSDPRGNQIRVYDAQTMAPLARWNIARPRQIALAPNGRLWVLQAGSDAGHAPQILSFDGEGKKPGAPLVLPRPMEPTALCVDRQNRLLVADNGPDQNVKIYADINKKPRLAGTFGVQGGVLAGRGRERGTIRPRHFVGLSGVGTDAAGNLYVATNGLGTSLDNTGTGAVLECYAPGSGARRWQLIGTQFVDMAGVDPTQNGRDVYTMHERFALDLNKKTPGGESRYVGYTLDRKTFPQDPRLHTSPYVAFVRRVNGRLLLYATGMYAEWLQVYRFDRERRGEIAIPSGFLAKGRVGEANAAAWPPHQPAKGEWIWRDANGNGRFDAGEYTRKPADPDTNAPGSWGWFVDERGGVWQATEGAGVRHLPLRGLDTHGSPVYDYAALQTFAAPAPFTRLERVEYDAKTDTLFLAGFTAERPYDEVWGIAGRVVCRYDNWLKGNRTPRWQTALPFQKGEPLTAIKAMAVAQDYLFAVDVRNAHVTVYRTSDGALVGTMTPGPEVGNYSGWVDIPYGIRAHKRPNGEYLVFVEEDARAKVMLYRWTPSTALVTRRGK